MAIDFTFTDEHEELRATLRAFLKEKSDEAAVREQMATERGYDPDVWEQMAGQMGLAGLIIPEEFGGAGYTYVELLVVMEEMGRSLLCAPYLGTAVLATNALLHCVDETTRKELLVGIAAGETIATVAHAESNGRWDLAGVEMRAEKGEGGFTLSGRKCWVLDGHTADVLLVVARHEAGLSLFRVDADATGLERTLVPSLDITRKLAQLDFNETPADLVSAGDQTDALQRVLALTVAALAAEQVGGAQMCLETATEYAKTRLQFGRPIGSYQAIKHKCADMLVEVEFAKSAAYAACFSAAGNEEDFLETAALAKAYCSEAYFHAAAENIQIHGGMGFTWELPVHLYFKRAKSSELFLGDAAYHRERLADLVGI
ncbi:MAG: acyl-CoA/acyl-ACP dehydrogenase [Deltaproteobacteria bacterium]|nr:acyl-CoA/acyl-ACP dehydrogenase [Deltaproteobacteria bacterium]MBW2396084.1 acyl-CoA/acyl-ACP dehydrogenase [Deltaproteobacteria bacterium]